MPGGRLRQLARSAALRAGRLKKRWWQSWMSGGRGGGTTWGIFVHLSVLKMCSCVPCGSTSTYIYILIYIYIILYVNVLYQFILYILYKKLLVITCSLNDKLHSLGELWQFEWDGYFNWNSRLPIQMCLVGGWGVDRSSLGVLDLIDPIAFWRWIQWLVFSESIWTLTITYSNIYIYIHTISIYIYIYSHIPCAKVCYLSMCQHSPPESTPPIHSLKASLFTLGLDRSQGALQMCLAIASGDRKPLVDMTPTYMTPRCLNSLIKYRQIFKKLSIELYTANVW